MSKNSHSNYVQGYRCTVANIICMYQANINTEKTLISRVNNICSISTQNHLERKQINKITIKNKNKKSLPTLVTLAVNSRKYIEKTLTKCSSP
jgi:hypothetical protein